MDFTNIILLLLAFKIRENMKKLIIILCLIPLLSTAQSPNYRGSAYKVAIQGQTHYKSLLNQGKIDSAEYIKLIKGETELNKMKYEKRPHKN